jgi:hypothetical protein
MAAGGQAIFEQRDLTEQGRGNGQALSNHLSAGYLPNVIGAGHVVARI